MQRVLFFNQPATLMSPVIKGGTGDKDVTGFFRLADTICPQFSMNAYIGLYQIKMIASETGQ